MANNNIRLEPKPQNLATKPKRGIESILCGLLLSFNIALDHLIKSRLDKETPRPTCSFILFVIMLLAVGVGITLIGNF